MWCTGGFGTHCAGKERVQLGDVPVCPDAGDVAPPFQSTCMDTAPQRHCTAPQAVHACCDELRELVGNRTRQLRPLLTARWHHPSSAC